MSWLLRLAIILLAIGIIFLLLFANKYVVANYWLPAVEDVDDEDPDDEQSSLDEDRD